MASLPISITAPLKGDTDPVAFRAFQRRCETLFALIAARGSTELGVAGIDWAQKQLADVPNNPATFIDFSVGADPETDVGQRYLRNKGGGIRWHLCHADVRDGPDNTRR